MPNHQHIFLEGVVTIDNYKPRPGRNTLNLPERNRQAHSQKLLTRLNSIWQKRDQEEEQRAAQHLPYRQGTYLSFISSDDHDLVTKSLEHIGKGIRLLNIQVQQLNEGHERTIATVYIPRGQQGYFLGKVQSYQSEKTPTGRPKNQDLVESIEDIQITLLESMWTDDLGKLPGTEESRWCEAWLRIPSNEDANEFLQHFYEILEIIDITYKSGHILFPERLVILIETNRAQLIELMTQADLLAEFRGGQETAGFWMKEGILGQGAWIQDLLDRTQIEDGSVKINILDSGVNDPHPLLTSLLPPNLNQTVRDEWGTNDHNPLGGHGTLMAGLCGYGELEPLFSSVNPVILTHGLSAVKIIPPPPLGPTPIELWGHITARAISLAEISSPEHSLIHCMAITAIEGVKRGRPSSWSGLVDMLAHGDDVKRLIIIAAGNVGDEDFKNYPETNYVSSIENPAQSWNALTVGAVTRKVQVNDPNYTNHIPLAKEYQLSPFSRTSLTWENTWPTKPDIVLEGGNLLRSPGGEITGHYDLEILSTGKRVNARPLDTIYATSSATALASNMAAKIASQYPNAWPETIRGLLVHMADWNDAMIEQLNVDISKKEHINRLLRCFGLDIPNLDKALFSQESALTYIAQEYIQPFTYGESSNVKSHHIHYYNLPWPAELLNQLGNTPVTLRVTISYFIDPSPGEIGWKDRYRYPSHGLRFDVKNTEEPEDNFKKRVNLAAREEGEYGFSDGDSGKWLIGKQNRSLGSIQSDRWDGTGSELSTCNVIAVYPTTGWWKERKHLDKVESQTKYSLLVTLETPEQEVELYTTVAQMVAVPVEVSAE